MQVMQGSGNKHYANHYIRQFRDWLQTDILFDRWEYKCKICSGHVHCREMQYLVMNFEISYLKG
jgi:hypothetical protein